MRTRGKGEWGTGNRSKVRRTLLRFPASCFLLLSLHFSACTERAAEPDGALVSALVAMHLLDARAAVTQGVPDSTREALLAHHGHTPASLADALADLARRPADYEATLAAVQESLATRLRTLPAPAVTPPAIMPPADVGPPSPLPPP
jgi:hypothetical protein